MKCNHTEKRNPRHWHCPIDLRQGRGGCVGYAITHAIASEPHSKKVHEHHARMINREAERIETMHNLDRPGTSIYAGMQAAMNLGLISEFYGVHSFMSMRGWLERGPVVFGLTMHKGMERPSWSNKRWIGITDKKKVVGHHAVCALGHDDRWFNGRFTYLQNSGGSEYGNGGVINLGDRDLKWLFKNGHVEAWAPRTAKRVT